MEQLIPFAFMITYMVVGAVASSRWTRRLRQRHPQSLRGDPAGWLRYWLPHLLAAEVFALLGTAITWVLTLALSPILRTPDGVYARIGATAALVLLGALCLVMNAVVLVRARRMARARRM